MKPSILFRIVYNLVKVFFIVFYNVTIEGRENLPSDKGFILASNHRTNADPPLVAIASRCSKFAFVAKEELFRNPIFGWLISRLGAFPVSRGKGDMSVIENAVEKVGEGRILVIFPEGTRSKDGTLGKGKTGVALIAAKSKAIVVPTAIIFKGKLKFRTKITVKFGKPIQPEEIAVGDELNTKELRVVKQRIMGDIQFLLEDKNGN